MSGLIKESVLELRNHRRKLEFEIYKLVKAFEGETGTCVDNVSVSQVNVSTIADERPRFETKVEVTIKI